MPAKKSAIDTALIRELADLLNDTDLNEIEVMEGELSIRLAKGVSGSVAYSAPVPAAVPPAQQQAVLSSDVQTSSPVVKTSGKSVPAPMVGTAYHCPAPDAGPFVAVGQKIKKGDTIMIIEAMKTMNQIPASQDGTVTEICVEDGQPVEFGEALITLE